MRLSKLKKITPLITILFVAYFVLALYKGLTTIDWQEVASSLALLDGKIIFVVAVVAVVNLLALTCFDQLAISYLAERVSRLKVSKVALISYVLNLNLGAILGSVGVRYRLYSKIGVNPLKIHLIVVFSALSNWMAYLFLLGLMALFMTPSFLASFPPILIKLGATTFLAINFIYLVGCFKGASFNIKATQFKLPPFHYGPLQIAIGSFQWFLQGLMIYLLFRFFNIPVGYIDVLATFLVAAIAGVLTHIPSGIGVLEAVFLSLTPQAYHPQVLASLIGFRAIYYLFPLSLALPSYFLIEAKHLYQKST